MTAETSEQMLRGQMYYADLDPVIGSEQGGVRPVLVIQNDIGNYHSTTVIVAPITSQVKKTDLPTHIGIPPFSGLPEQSMAMLEQIRTIDKSRLGAYVGRLDNDVMDAIDHAIGISVGLDALSVGVKWSRQQNAARNEMMLCLCPTCARQFINSPAHIIRRVDPLQREKDTCTYCGVRQGYDYRIIHRKKRMGDDRY